MSCLYDYLELPPFYLEFGILNFEKYVTYCTYNDIYKICMKISLQFNLRKKGALMKHVILYRYHKI